MSRISYVNGRYVPHADAVVHIEDRGYQFSDGIYEVVGVHNGIFLDEQGHLERMQRSLHEVQIDAPVSMRALRLIIREIKRRNKLTQGMVYLQATRGVAPRLHTFPRPPVTPALVVTAQHKPMPTDEVIKKGVSVITQPEMRWKRCDIKSISLLPNVLAKHAAYEQGCAEAWLVDEKGFVTEGTASNAWIINQHGQLQTCPTGPEILGGITRETLLKVAKTMGLEVLEEKFTCDDVTQAREAFITSATNYVMPVTSFNGKPLAHSKGPDLGIRLRAAYLEEVMRVARELDS